MIEPCPSDEDLAAYVHDNVSPHERAHIEAHLTGCSQCREIVVFTFQMTAITPPPKKPSKPTDA